MMAPAQFTWIFIGNRSDAYKVLRTPPIFLKFWPCWLQRHFDWPQLFYLNTEIIISKVFVTFDGSSKVNLCSILRDGWTNLRTVLVSQNNLKNTWPCAGTIHNQLWYEV